MDFAQSIPKLTLLDRTENTLSCNLYLTDNSLCFAGHFPTRPIVPGVIQLGWALQFGKDLGLPPENFLGISRCKFMAVIEPFTTITLTLRREQSRLNFTLESEEHVHASGTLTYAT